MGGGAVRFFHVKKPALFAHANKDGAPARI